MSHEFISFIADMTRLSYKSWMDLGEVNSKCLHLAQVPLQPSVAEKLHLIYLAKGVHATTAIEGNTLTEQQVLLQINGDKPDVPKSREYQVQEVENIKAILNKVSQEVTPGSQYLLTASQILQIHGQLFEGIETEKHVTPGNFRTVGVGVADYGAPDPQHVQDLIDRLCEWLNGPAFVQSDEDLLIPMAVLRAILAHLYIAWIHPFGDGNGRTARALEFLILVGAGVPSPAAHLLSNHYHLTRSKYYQELQYASNSGDPLSFVSYAIGGFKDGLREQLKDVYKQLVRISMKDFIYESFSVSGLDGRQKAGVERRRKLTLAFAGIDRPATFEEVLQENVDAALAYKGVTRPTVQSDLVDLVEGNWLIQIGKTYQCNKNRILRFRPRSGVPMAVPALDI